MDSGYILEDIVGIGVVFPNNGYLASCWKDEAAEAISSGNYEAVTEEIPRAEAEANREIQGSRELQEAQESQESREPQEERELQATQEAGVKEQAVELVTYQKIELNQIRQLPSPNWYLCNNRFLVHGFFNYGYLILKKALEADKEMAWLGVPGIFEKPEMVMATLLGFPEFEALPMEISETQMGETLSIANIEKSQEPKAGTFGCWLIPLK